MEVYSLVKSYFEQNYCHACHTRFAVFYPLPSCCVFATTILRNGPDKNDSNNNGNKHVGMQKRC